MLTNHILCANTQKIHHNWHILASDTSLYRHLVAGVHKYAYSKRTGHLHLSHARTHLKPLYPYSKNHVLKAKLYIYIYIHTRIYKYTAEDEISLQVSLRVTHYSHKVERTHTSPFLYIA